MLRKVAAEGDVFRTWQSDQDNVPWNASPIEAVIYPPAARFFQQLLGEIVIPAGVRAVAISSLFRSLPLRPSAAAFIFEFPPAIRDTLWKSLIDPSKGFDQIKDFGRTLYDAMGKSKNLTYRCELLEAAYAPLLESSYVRRRLAFPYTVVVVHVPLCRSAKELHFSAPVATQVFWRKSRLASIDDDVLEPPLPNIPVTNELGENALGDWKYGFRCALCEGKLSYSVNSKTGQNFVPRLVESAHALWDKAFSFDISNTLFYRAVKTGVIPDVHYWEQLTQENPQKIVELPWHNAGTLRDASRILRPQDVFATPKDVNELAALVDRCGVRV